VLCRPGSTITCHNDAFCDGAHVTCPEGSPSSNVGDKCFG
jgi:CDGSH-type Zn-finger protein